MKLEDAANILNLSGNVTPKDVKKAYRKAAMKYHPDRNPAGADMMKVINAAYDALKDFEGVIPESTAHDNTENSQQTNYGEAVNAALNAIFGLEGLNIEVCGAWIWVSGETFQHKAALKEAGFKFAPKKKRWYFRPTDWVSRSRNSLSMDEIRGKYGSDKPASNKARYKLDNSKTA